MKKVCDIFPENFRDGTLIEYVIDGKHRRVGKKVNGVLVQGLLYGNQLNPVAELDGTGNVVATFIYGTKANIPDYVVKNNVTYRIVTDHLGSPIAIVDTTTGTIVEQISYDEYGNVLSDTNPGFLPFGFAGGLYEPRTGLVRFGFRDYDPSAGRWTSKDPIRFAGGGASSQEILQLLGGYCRFLAYFTPPKHPFHPLFARIFAFIRIDYLTCRADRGSFENMAGCRIKSGMTSRYYAAVILNLTLFPLYSEE